MDREKHDLLIGLGYTHLGGQIYSKGMRMEAISDVESYEELKARLEGEKDTDIPLSPWRSVLPILRSYHTDPKFAAFFGIIDTLATCGKLEEEPEGEPEEEKDDKETVKGKPEAGEDDVECYLETEQQAYAAEWIKNIPTPVLYRMTVQGKRVYFEIGEDNYPIIYDGATNNIGNGYQDSGDALNRWKNDIRLKGKDPDEIANYRADLGTIMHYLFGLYMMGMEIKLRPSWIRKVVKDARLRVSSTHMERILVDNMDELIDDIVSFAMFCEERNVKPVLIEKMLRSRRLMVASSVDAVVEMDGEVETVEMEVETGEVYKRGPKKGQPKTEVKTVKRRRRIFAILDFKSNKNGDSYDEHAFQLEMYRRMILENYGKILEIEEIYNFFPGNPAAKTASARYTLRRQTENPVLRMATVVYLQGKYKFERTNYTVTTRAGSVTLGSGVDAGKLIRTESLRDYIYRVMSERNQG